MHRFPAFALALAAACTSGAPATRPSPTSSTAVMSPPGGRPVSEFEVARAYRTLVDLTKIGPREDTDPAFGRAVDYIARSFRTLGYSVERQRFGVPSGRSAGVSIPAGTSENVVAVPPGFDPGRPHALVGAHLDTVPRSPGANDNASGVAVMMELARLGMQAPLQTPLVFVAFGGEERRRPGAGGTLYGSRHYVSSMRAQQRAALRGVVILDVVGRGSVVRVCSDGRTRKDLIRTMLAAARRIRIPARECVSTRRFSDNVTFERAGFTVAWFYTGNFAQLHTRRDTVSIISRAHLRNVGRVAWEALRTLRL